MTPKPQDDERRNAERFALPRAARATFGGFDAAIVEVSLIGCQIEHADRIAPRAGLPLRFKWHGQPVSVEATVIRSEMRSIRGKPGYLSGLIFCESASDSPPVIREIVSWLTEERAKRAAQEKPAAPDADEAEVVSTRFLQCRLTGGKWDKLYVEKPEQPPEGFTIVAPSNEAEVDVLCRTYQSADAQHRRMMRAAFEQAIAQSGGKSG